MCGVHYVGPLHISIHALREEGDGVWRAREDDRKNFYPRPPRGGRLGKNQLDVLVAGFLSTPSARRATWMPSIGEFPNVISIHALREEGDYHGSSRRKT